MSLIDEALARAAEERRRGELESAAATLDAVAFQDRNRILPLLREILDFLALTEHGLAFRYVPAGSFIMGCDDGEPDEAPAHPVTLPAFWMSEAPLSYVDFARVLGWPEPPDHPGQEQVQKLVECLEQPSDFYLRYCVGTKIRRRYCVSESKQAGDGHVHHLHGGQMEGAKKSIADWILGAQRPSASLNRYDEKPMVAVTWDLSNLVGHCMSTKSVEYRLPSEAEWERAARSCFRAAPFPWGDAPPDASRADFDRFREFSLCPSRIFPPNDYGLFALAGGVWEWCADDYDATFYQRSPRESPLCSLPTTIPDREHVLRGGSWADCADVLRTSFRASSQHDVSPTIGFRLVRLPRTPQHTPF